VLSDYTPLFSHHRVPARLGIAGEMGKHNGVAPERLNTHPHSTLPSYLSEAFSDLYAQDGLVVLGRGLGWLGLLCSFVRFYSDTSDDGYAATIDEDKMDGNNRICQRKPPLVFVLNLRDEERSVLLSTLSSWGTPPEALPRIITNEAGQSTERSALYARGGVFIVTSRILIVDLLQGTAQARDIEGLLVAHAERVVGEKSVEAFILRIFRSQKYFISVSSTTKEETDPAGNNQCGARGGFIKAFSDDASSLVSGSFAKVEKVLKSLQVPRLFLYPRFHASVAEELERNPPTVIELHQPLSESMKSIQNYLAASIRSCLRDLRQRSTLVDLSFLFDAGNRKRKRKSDSSIDMFGLANNRTKRTKEEGMNDWKFTIQQCIATNFSFILSRQLEGDWHRLSWDVKQCISDLRTLSQLFHHLIEYGECLSEPFQEKSN
jgi:DNA excision repair protein ERCC-4